MLVMLIVYDYRLFWRRGDGDNRNLIYVFVFTMDFLLLHWLNMLLKLPVCFLMHVWCPHNDIRIGKVQYMSLKHIYLHQVWVTAHRVNVFCLSIIRLLVMMLPWVCLSSARLFFCLNVLTKGNGDVRTVCVIVMRHLAGFYYWFYYSATLSLYVYLLYMHMTEWWHGLKSDHKNNMRQISFSRVLTSILYCYLYVTNRKNQTQFSCLTEGFASSSWGLAAL